MKEFYFKDKTSNISLRGIVPQNDTNWPPLDYFRLCHAYNFSNSFSEILKHNCPIDIPDSIVKKFVLERTNELILKQLNESAPNHQIHELFANDSLSKKDQEKLLTGITLNSSDLLWLNKEAQDLGYLMDIYHIEKYPAKFDEKQKPMCYHQNENGTIETIGHTDMSEGEMRALLEQRKVVQARIYHKDNAWHCFYFTFKGLSGLEGGARGSKPHYHYLSNKSGIQWNELLNRIKECNMPATKIHVVINR